MEFLCNVAKKVKSAEFKFSDEQFVASNVTDEPLPQTSGITGEASVSVANQEQSTSSTNNTRKSKQIYPWVDYKKLSWRRDGPTLANRWIGHSSQESTKVNAEIC